MEKNDLIIRIAGQGGEGVISTGDFIAAACARAGQEVTTFKTFPAEIKGGYAMYQILHILRIGFLIRVTPLMLKCAFNGEAFTNNQHRLVLRDRCGLRLSGG